MKKPLNHIAPKENETFPSPNAKKVGVAQGRKKVMNFDSSDFKISLVGYGKSYLNDPSSRPSIPDRFLHSLDFFLMESPQKTKVASSSLALMNYLVHMRAQDLALVRYYFEKKESENSTFIRSTLGVEVELLRSRQLWLHESYNSKGESVEQHLRRITLDGPDRWVSAFQYYEGRWVTLSLRETEEEPLEEIKKILTLRLDDLRNLLIKKKRGVYLSVVDECLKNLESQSVVGGSPSLFFLPQNVYSPLAHQIVNIYLKIKQIFYKESPVENLNLDGEITEPFYKGMLRAVNSFKP